MIHSASPQLRSGPDRPSTRSAAGSSLTSRNAPSKSTSRDHLFDAELASVIRLRIESRLPGRVRELDVTVTRNTVILAGHCNTYYTKQLAQHTAMGVLEYERLTNNIEVNRPK